MPNLLTKIELESAHSQALSLFRDKQTTDVDHHISLTANPPYALRYTTQKNFPGEENWSYGRIALIDPNGNFPEIPKDQDGLQTPVRSQEVGLRDFLMQHNKSPLITSIFSGLHVRKEYSGLRIGSLLIGLSNEIIEDLIIRFLADQPNTRVYAYIADAAHSNGTDHNRSGWTSYQSEKLGYKGEARIGDLLPSFKKRYPVKKILTTYSKNSPTLSTLHPHHPA